ncbi:MAG: pseudouridine synthase [Termitinemataceae bacterium]|nr:MAG: pseudouridine synthase [Termitinemataceae bacterium]
MDKDERQLIRLQVFLSHCGLASRRAAEKFILDGRVSVNGTVVRELGTKVSGTETITFDGCELNLENEMQYLALNKPPFFLCSSYDPENRPLAKDLLPKTIKQRLYNVGRLDYLSCGLVLFTNDGKFASIVGHPSAQIEKEYIVESPNFIPESLLDAFLAGIEIEGEVYKCKAIEKTDRKSIRVVLIEGKNREIRKVFSHFHLHAKSLCRVRIGQVMLGSLTNGQTRALSTSEIESLIRKNQNGKRLPDTKIAHNTKKV